MKTYRFISILFLLLFLSGSLLQLTRHSQPQSSDKELLARGIVLSSAQQWSEKAGSPPYYKGFKNNPSTGKPELAGIAYLTTDVVPDIKGYGGPIAVMVGVKPDATVSKIHIISHNETSSYISGGIDEFLNQFQSKTSADEFKLGRDLDGITGATISSEAIGQAVEKSLKIMAHQVLGQAVKGRPFGSPLVRGTWPKATPRTSTASSHGLKPVAPDAVSLAEPPVKGPSYARPLARGPWPQWPRHGQVLHQATGMPVASDAVKKIPGQQVFIPILAFILAVTGVISRKKIFRWAALLTGLLYLGILQKTMISVVQIANIGLGQIPSFVQSPLSWVLIGLTLVSSFVWGQIFCGSLCPFGALQELLYTIRERLGWKKFKTEFPSEPRARYLKYLVLFAALLIAYAMGHTQAVGIEPYLTLYTGNGSVLAWTLVGLMIFIGCFNFRFWCKFLCPTGACLGLPARVSIFRIRINKDCNGCQACANVCPTQAIRNSQNETGLPFINHSECILCGNCVRQCAQKAMVMKPQETQALKAISLSRGAWPPAFVSLVLMGGILVAAQLVQNIRLVQKPLIVQAEQAAVTTQNTDTETIKKEIDKAGIVPHPASHWEEINI